MVKFLGDWGVYLLGMIITWAAVAKILVENRKQKTIEVLEKIKVELAREQLKVELEQSKIAANLKQLELQSATEMARLCGESVKLITEDVKILMAFKEKSQVNEHELRILVDRLIADLRLLMEQLIENALPKK